MLRRLLTLVALTLLVPADAPARVRVRAPDVVVGGSEVIVRGHARGDVTLERLRRRWVGVDRGRSGSFSLSWRAPRRRTVARLRVVVRRRGRVVGVSQVKRVAVSPTAVLRSASVLAAPGPGAAGSVRFGGRPPARVGEFLAAGVGPATPYGLLARVVGVRAGGRVADVVPASLSEAVPAGRVAVGAGRAPRAKAGPQRPQRAKAGPAAARTFRSPFACMGSVGATLDGSLAVQVVPRFELEWAWGEVRSALARVTLRGDARLAARIEAAGSCGLPETRVAGWDAPPLRTFVGPIPVVVVPRTTLYVSGEAVVEAPASASLSGSLRATAGLRWDGAAVHPIGSFHHRLIGEARREGARAALAARLTPSVEFLFYGQAGPRFDLSAGLSLDALAEPSPSWTLTAPVELSAGLAVPSFPGLAIPQRTVLRRRFPLAAGPVAGSPQPDAYESPSPTSPAPPRGRERARIAWDTAATDVDLHVWDAAGHHAWFRDPAAIPDGTLSEDDRHGFGPELFHDAAPGGRALSYGLCYFDDSGAGPTHVSVRLTHPDGSVRDSTVTLASEGDHRLIGSSPPGSGFTPPPGWCDP
jgi:hypothetical protein